jgi:hypothetical protein
MAQQSNIRRDIPICTGAGFTGTCPPAADRVHESRDNDEICEERRDDASRRWQAELPA